jgi:hypothetical protein
VAHRDGDKLLAAYANPEFVAALDALAKAEGISRSELIRAALVRAALDLPEDAQTPTPSEGVT